MLLANAEGYTPVQQALMSPERAPLAQRLTQIVEAQRKAGESDVLLVGRACSSGLMQSIISIMSVSVHYFYL